MDSYQEQLSNEKICLSIKTLFLNIISIEINRHDTILNLKTLIKEKESIAIFYQTLIHNNNKLNNKRTLSSYSINSGDTLYLVLREIKKKRPKKSREFKLIVEQDKVTGEYQTEGSFIDINSMRAANKAFTSIMRKIKNTNGDKIKNSVEFKLLKTSKNNKQKIYTYQGTRRKL